MGLAQSVYGVLTDAMRISDGAEFQVARGIHPKVEPEIAFVTSRELRGDIELKEAEGAIASICAALDFAHLKMRLLVDGALKTEAESSAISGNPVESLVQLLALLRGEELPAGSLVLTGAAAGAEPLSPGQMVELEVTGLAPVCLWAV